MAPRFLDTNIIIRYLTQDDEAKAARALALLLRVERGQERVATSPMVIFEAVFILEKSYRTPRRIIRERLDKILSARGLELSNKGVYRAALDLYATTNVSFADPYNASFMRHGGLTEIYSWDSDFDKLAGIVRVEPEQNA